MRVTATPVEAKNLKPGDLFSTGGPDYWLGAVWALSVGEKVYIRTNAPCPPDQEEEAVYRIEIEED